MTATHLREIGGLRPGLDINRAGAIIALLTEPLVYRRRVVDAGWPEPEYRAWLEETAAAALLPR